MPSHHTPRGFLCAAQHIGIKRRKLDFSVVHSTVPCRAAAVFTKNTFGSPSVKVGREHVADGVLQTVVVTSGIANVATGETGLANTREITRLAGSVLDVPPTCVLASSTGLIGPQLPMEKIRKALGGVKDALGRNNFHEVARAIMTTDTRIKIESRAIGDAYIVGIAKGSGMIEPDMATMLAYFYTDADIPEARLDAALRRAVNLSFNMISVDSDSSTSDTVAILANGLAGPVDPDAFEAVLTEMAIEMAKAIVRDGEGATKVIAVTVEGAEDFAQAKRFAKSIVNSPLVKTAVYGCDPNWGRIAMAIGKTQERCVDPDKLSIWIGPHCLYRRGLADDQALEPAGEHLRGDEVEIRVNVGAGDGSATVWGCDLTEEYVRINALYTT